MERSCVWTSYSLVMYEWILKYKWVVWMNNKELKLFIVHFLTIKILLFLTIKSLSSLLFLDSAMKYLMVRRIFSLKLAYTKRKFIERWIVRTIDISIPNLHLQLWHLPSKTSFLLSKNEKVLGLTSYQHVNGWSNGQQAGLPCKSPKFELRWRTN